MWPGYMTDVKCVTDGIFLLIDTTTKFIAQDTILDKIRGMQRDRYSKQEITDALVPKDPDEKRAVVITMHNAQIYQLDGIRFDLTPKTHSFDWTFINP